MFYRFWKFYKGIQLKKLLLSIVCLGLVACNGSEQAQTPAIGTTQPTTTLQCSKDTDCKGDRICEAGVCAAPASTGTVAPIVATLESANTPKPVEKTDEYKQAYSCAMEGLKEGQDSSVIYCVGATRDPSAVEEKAFSDAAKAYFVGDSVVTIPGDKHDCPDVDAYETALRKKGLKPKMVMSDGEGAPGPFCAYDITPAPGTRVKKGSTVRFKVAGDLG